MREKYGFVYIWRDKKHNRYYIGCHWGFEDDGYVCSSRWMRQAYRKRPQDFKRRTLSYVYTSRADLLNEEGRWLALVSDTQLGTRYYNLTNHQNGHWTSEEERRLSIGQKISASVKAHRETPEGRAAYLAGIEKKRGRKQSAATVAKRAEGIKSAMATKYPIEERKQRSVKGSVEHSQKLSNASNRRWADPEAKSKQAEITRSIHTGKQHRLGHKSTPEHVAKIAAANTGKVRTAEQKEKLRQAKLGTKATAEQKQARSERMKQMWELRKSGILPMPKYN